jgi:hypothetical protein
MRRLEQARPDMARLPKGERAATRADQERLVRQGRNSLSFLAEARKSRLH